MPDRDWVILNDVLSTVEGSALVRLARLGTAPEPEDVPASQLPACFVDYAGTDEFPAAGDDEVFSALRFTLRLVVKGRDESERVEQAIKLANDLKDALMVDRFRSQNASYGPAQKPTEFGPARVSTRAKHPFTVLEIQGSCGFYTSDVSR